MRQATLACILAGLQLIVWSPKTSAEPINYLAGSIYHYQLTSDATGAARPWVTITFGPAEATYANGGAISPAATTLGSLHFAVRQIPVDNGMGGIGQILMPLNNNAGQTIDFGSGIASFLSNFTMASVEMNVNAPVLSGLGQSLSLNPFPATPPGQNGLTLLGTVSATGNTSTEDLSLFGPDSGGIFAITLMADDPNFNFADFIMNGGTIEGQGAFQMIGGSLNSGTEVPEPLSLVLWAAVGTAGFVSVRRMRKR